MRILHLLSTVALSGAENVAADICLMFENTHEMAYCSPNGRVAEALAARGIEFIPLKRLGVLEARRAIQEFRPDVIHAHDVKATVVATLATARPRERTPIVSHLHVNDPRMRRVSLKSVCYWWAARRASRLLSVTAGCLDEFAFARFLKVEQSTVANIVSTKRIARLMPASPEPLRHAFVFFGRLEDQKDPLRAAQIAVRVLQLDLRAEFVVVGDGTLRAEMEEVFRVASLLDRVEFRGDLLSPYAAVAACRTMLMCSKFEGLPLAALEAMYLGVPLVTTGVDGIRTVVVDGVSGRICTSDDALVAEIVKLMNEDSAQSRLASGARASFANHVDEVGYRRAVEEVYHGALRSGSH